MGVIFSNGALQGGGRGMGGPMLGPGQQPAQPNAQTQPMQLGMNPMMWAGQQGIPPAQTQPMMPPQMLLEGNGPMQWAGVHPMQQGAPLQGGIQPMTSPGMMGGQHPEMMGQGQQEQNTMQWIHQLLSHLQKFQG